jgi:hypothetical protein
MENFEGASKAMQELLKSASTLAVEIATKPEQTDAETTFIKAFANFSMQAIISAMTGGK